MSYPDFPKYWDDDIDWSLNAKPTIRHILAIYQAISERFNFCTDTIYFFYENLLTWGMAPYSAKKIGRLRDLADNLSQVFLECLSYPNPYLKIGCFGAGRLEFNLSDDGPKKARWYDDTNEDSPDSFYNKIIKDYYTKRIPINSYTIDYGNFVTTMIDKYPRIMESDKMSVANKKMMAWLIGIKNELNKLHSIFVPCSLGYPVKVDGITDTYGEHYEYEKYDGKVETDEWNSSRRHVISTKILTGGVHNSKDEYSVTKFYSAYVNAPPISIKNQLPIAYNASLHISGYCEQDNGFGEDNRYEYYEIEPIGDFIKKIGWNSLGVLQPNEEKQILDASFCYNGNGVRRYWNKYGGRDNCDISFSAQIDCIRLDFRVEGGFKFI